MFSNCTYSYSTSLLIVFLFLMVNKLVSQENFAVDSLRLNPTSAQDSIPPSYLRNGYLKETPRISTNAVVTLHQADFNHGLISDPLLLFQGRLPGVQIYQRGGDPNGTSLTRIRGLSGGMFRQEPLIVVDGIAGAYLNNVEPNDITSVSILKDAAAQAIYGMRGSNGVILINTQSSNFANDTLTISYNGQLATSNVFATRDVFSAEEFRAAGGFDIGGATDWQEAITRTGISNVHTLAISGRKAATHYRVSGSYRSVQGVLKESGFKKYNIRLALQRSAFREKLNLRINAAFASNQGQPGFREAFQYASSFNPTAPINGANTLLPFAEEDYGGYYENIGLFQSFNPLALLELNERSTLAQTLSSTIHLDYLLGKSLRLNLRHTFQDDFLNLRESFSPFSYYGRGNYRTIPYARGNAFLSNTQQKFTLYEAYFNWRKQTKRSLFEWTLGTAYHDGQYDTRSLRVRGLITPVDLSPREIGETAAYTSNATSLNDALNGWNDLLSSVFSSVSWNIRNIVYLDASLRTDESSKLGSANQRGSFAALSGAIDLKELGHIEFLDALNIRASYGTTGGLPSLAGLSQDGREFRILADGSVQEEATREPNEELGWEKKNEFNIGLEFGQGGFLASIDWYTKRATDFIGTRQTAVFTNFFENQYGLKANGIDIRLTAVRGNQNFKFTGGLSLSIYRSEFQDIDSDFKLLSSPGGFTQEPILVIENGRPWGTIYAPLYSGDVDVNGAPIFVDVNGDGAFNSTGSSFRPEDDFIISGSGVPDIELGWSTRLQYRRWEVSAFFRGAFGHVLVNRARQFQEPIVNNLLVSNVLQTPLRQPELKRSFYSSFFVESADFLKLDNLTLAKTILLKQNRKLCLSITGQNLLVLTDYAGIDPEPALEDLGSEFSSNLQVEFPLLDRNPFMTGIDRQNTYLPSKTVVFGLSFSW